MTVTRRGFLLGTLLAPLLKFLPSQRPKPVTTRLVDFESMKGRIYYSPNYHPRWQSKEGFAFWLKKSQEGLFESSFRPVTTSASGMFHVEPSSGGFI